MRQNPVFASWRDDHCEVWARTTVPTEYRRSPAGASSENRGSSRICRHHMVTVANGVLRLRLGVAPLPHATSGASFWAKAMLQKAMRLKARHRAPCASKFRHDPHQPGAIAEIEVAAT